MRLRDTADKTAFPQGCGKAVLNAQHWDALRDLSHTIIDTLGAGNLVSWGEGVDIDVKTRGYATLAGGLTEWSSVQHILDAGILLHHEGADSDPDARKKHLDTAEKSFTALTPNATQLTAIHAVIDAAQSILLSDKSIKPYERDSLALPHLVALQPNVHNGDPLLPLHMDQPRHDGFGVVIVTVAIQGRGDVVIVNDGEEGDDGPPQSWAFPLHPGEMYVLAGPARNLCRHGVIEDTKSSKKRHPSAADADKDRISLNLRFGIHTAEQAHADIGRWWKD